MDVFPSKTRQVRYVFAFSSRCSLPSIPITTRAKMTKMDDSWVCAIFLAAGDHSVLIAIKWIKRVVFSGIRQAWNPLAFFFFQFHKSPFSSSHHPRQNRSLVNGSHSQMEEDDEDSIVARCLCLDLEKLLLKPKLQTIFMASSLILQSKLFWHNLRHHYLAEQSYNHEAYKELMDFLNKNSMNVDGDQFCAKLMRESPRHKGLAMRILEVRSAYCKNDFEWDNLKKLSVKMVDKSNTRLMRDYVLETSHIEDKEK